MQHAMLCTHRLTVPGLSLTYGMAKRVQTAAPTRILYEAVTSRILQGYGASVKKAAHHRSNMRSMVRYYAADQRLERCVLQLYHKAQVKRLPRFAWGRWTRQRQ